MAAGDAVPFPKKNAAYRVYFPILDADGDLVTGAASLDSERSLDGGTFANCSNEATEIATSSGMYFLDLNASEMNTDCTSVIVKTGTAGAKTTPMVLYTVERLYDEMSSDIAVIESNSIVIESNTVVLESDSIIIQSQVLITQSEVSNILSDTTVIESNSIVTESNTVVLESDSITIQSMVLIVKSNTSDILSDTTIITSDTLVIESQTTVIESNSIVIESDTIVISSDTVVIESDTTRLELALIAATGALEATPTSTSLQTDLPEATDDHYNNMVFVMTSGDEAGEARRIDDYTGLTGTITLETALSGSPTSGETFAILNIPVTGEQADIDAMTSDLIIVESNSIVTESNTIVLESDSIIIQSQVLITQSEVSNILSDTAVIESQTTVIESNSIVTESNTIVLESDSITIQSMVLVSQSEISNILSDTAVIESQTTVIESNTVVIESDTIVISSDTLAIESQTTVIESNSIVLESDSITIQSDLVLQASYTVIGTVDTVTNTHTPTTTEFQADDITEATADHFNGRIVIFTSGVLKDQATDITDYAAVGGIGQFTVTAMTEAPSNNDTFVIV